MFLFVLCAKCVRCFHGEISFLIQLNKMDFFSHFIDGNRGLNEVIYLAQGYIGSKWKTYNQN